MKWAFANFGRFNGINFDFISEIFLGLSVLTLIVVFSLDVSMIFHFVTRYCVMCLIVYYFSYGIF